MSKQLTTIKVLEYDDNGTDKILHELDGVKKILKFDLSDVVFQDDGDGGIEPVGTYALSPNAAAGNPEVYAMGEPGSKQVIVLGDVPEPAGTDYEIANFRVDIGDFDDEADPDAPGDGAAYVLVKPQSWDANGQLINLYATVVEAGYGLFEWYIRETGQGSYENIGSYSPPYPESDAFSMTGPAYSLDVVLVIRQNV